MNWNNLTQMVDELGLKSNPENIHEIETEIKTLRSKNHPDRSGGNFKSESDEKQFYRLSEALDYCETFQNTLIPIDAVTALVQNVGESLSLTNKESVETRIIKASKEMETRLSQKYRLPKISLGTITGILIYAFLFPQTFSEHPYISELIFMDNFLLTWFFSVFFLALLWLIIWKFETQRKVRIRKLLSLDIHRLVLDKTRQSRNIFSRTQLRNELAEQIYNHIPLFFSTFLTLDLETLDEATDLAIERYLERNWISRIQQTEIDDFYEITI